MKQNRNDIIKEIIRFLIVGVICTIVDYIFFYTFNLIILKKIDRTINLIISTAVGFMAGFLVNWLLQKFVYRYLDKSQTKSKKVFTLFFIFAVMGFLITEGGILLGKPLYEEYYIFGIDFWKLFFKCMMTGIVMVFNYLTRKLIVFRKKALKEEIKAFNESIKTEEENIND